MNNKQFILTLLDHINDNEVTQKIILSLLEKVDDSTERNIIIELLSLCNDYDGIYIPDQYKKYLFDKTDNFEELFI